ncbi:MAG: 23S rRNA (guanosine(2251)-2'-O)-methyltransferase RlmB [Clostridiales bacterium]|nr:23S rRNA (guanosine(2251)-2'-O)-methyltransferase RlmB [Clostridiales bacterium]
MADQRRPSENSRSNKGGARRPESGGFGSKRNSGENRTARPLTGNSYSGRRSRPDFEGSSEGAPGRGSASTSGKSFGQGSARGSAPTSGKTYKPTSGARPRFGGPSVTPAGRRPGPGGGRPFSQTSTRGSEPFAAREIVPQERNPQAEDAAPDDRLEGRNPIMEALRAGRTFNKIWVASSDGSRLDPTIGRIIAMARDQGIPLVEVPRTVLDKMSSTRIHQGVIAQIASHDYIEIDEMIEQATKKEGDPFLVMLDSLKDSYNLGSVLRIADAAGVDGIIIPRHRSIGLDATVAKTSSGAIEYVPVARVTNLSRTIDDLKKKGFWVFGTDASAEMPYDKANYGGPLLLIIGSEGEGVHENILSKCDVTVSVPMEGHVNSLNAAVAAGVIVFEAKRQRKNAEHK